MANNLYELLEVNPSASQEAIASSYQRLHAKYSDQAGNGGEDATNLLIALREARHILSDPERRRRYDEKLEARQSEFNTPTPQPNSFFKLLVIAGIIGFCSLGYAKYQSELEKARLEREKTAAMAKQAEIEAQKEREEKLAAQQAIMQQRRDESIERYNRERDMAYANQVSRDIQRAESQARREAEQQRANIERQQRYEAERQLAKDKAYLRQLEAENSRYRRY